MIKAKSTNQEETIVLVPAAGYVNNACNYDLAFDDPSFLNIGTNLAIDEIKKKNKFKIVLGVKNKEKDFYKLNPYNNVEIIEIGNTKNVTITIKKILIKLQPLWCLINPITTIPSEDNIETEKGFIEFGSEKIAKENWSSLTFDKNNEPLFHSKLDKKSYRLESYPFTGRIFAKSKDILKTIDELKNSKQNDLINLAEALFRKKKVNINYTCWLDIGHIATYPLTKVSSINSRFFNNLNYDKKRNVINKISENKYKIENEIKFYKSIPRDIKRFFPLILNIARNEKNVSYDMEYIGNPTLAEVYLFSKIGPNAIERIFNSLNFIYSTFYEKDFHFIENVSWLYTEKNFNRQQEVEKLIRKKDYFLLKEIYFKDFIINKLRLPSLKKTFEKLNYKLTLFEKEKAVYFGHGDLCFNNILVDPLFGKVNLIDPKANRNKNNNIVGLIDKNYDLAKLNHSIMGLYDSVVNNLFELKIIDLKNINFKIYKPAEYEIYNYYFKEIVIQDRISKENLSLLTGNLFLSMLPLHLDDRKRMIALSLLGNLFLNGYSIDSIF